MTRRAAVDALSPAPGAGPRGVSREPRRLGETVARSDLIGVFTDRDHAVDAALASEHGSPDILRLQSTGANVWTVTWSLRRGA